VKMRHISIDLPTLYTMLLHYRGKIIFLVFSVSNLVFSGRYVLRKEPTFGAEMRMQSWR